MEREPRDRAPEGGGYLMFSARPPDARLVGAGVDAECPADVASRPAPLGCPGFERVAQHRLQRQIMRADPLDANACNLRDARRRQDERRDVGCAAPPAPRVGGIAEVAYEIGRAHV